MGILVLVMCAGLSINPFKKKTTTFLLAFFGGLIGLASILVLLNLATNISIIADARFATNNIAPPTEILLKWIPGFFAFAGAIVGAIFVSTRIARLKKLQTLRNSIDQMLEQNEDMLEKISGKLASGERQDMQQVCDIREYIKNQRADFPDLTIIFPGTFERRVTFHYLDKYTHISEEKDAQKFTAKYFACTPNYDCEFLNSFFSGEPAETLQHGSDNDFKIYVPIKGKETRFVLLFSQRDTFGKIGS